MFDAIVVGARAAGAPLAMNLARGGRRVLAVDRAARPGPPRPAEALTGRAVFRLERWGLLEALKATNVPPMRRITMTCGEGAIDLPFRDDLPGYCPRRDILDGILLEAAREAGVEVREGVNITGVLRDEKGRVTGIEGIGPDGDPVREEAAIVIGADGRRSIIADAVRARTYSERPGRTCCFFSTWSHVAVEGIEAYFLRGCAIIVYPTNDGRTSLGALFPIGEYEQIKSRIDEVLQEKLAGVPGLALRLKAGVHDGTWWGYRWPGSYYRDIHGPGWILAGDAAYLKEPILGQGVNDAFRDADQVARAIEENDTDDGLAAALRDYQEHRDRITAGIYDASYEFAGLDVTPRMLGSLASYVDTTLR